MRLIRYGTSGKEKPGVMIEGKKYALPGFKGDYDRIFFEKNGISTLAQVILEGRQPLKVLDPAVRLGPPVTAPSKIICVGLNFADHAQESGAVIPVEPIIFFKAPSALNGPCDDVILPRDSKKTDWEVELALVIGARASYVSEDNAMRYVAGYMLHNDYSEREFQLERGGQWVKGKSCDTFAPLGPFLATADEIKDVDNLGMWLSVNGKIFQQSNTSNMIFKVPFLVSYISQFMTLLPGDIISTGTPAGVGLGIRPEPEYLKAGDVVELGIENLGSSKQHIKPFRS
jgi:2,4-diketo-3-deoxy-L-fuconate hydrolase